MFSMRSHFTPRFLFLLICIFLIVSCAAPTATPVLPTETAQPSATLPPPTETALPTDTPTSTPLPQPALTRPQYKIDLQFNFTTKIATVYQTITYPNWTGETLNNIVLVVEPNLWNGGFTINALSKLTKHSRATLSGKTQPVQK